MLFNEEEMIKLCQELGIDLVESETKKPQLNGKDLEIEDIVSIFSMPVSICELDYRQFITNNTFIVTSDDSFAA